MTDNPELLAIVRKHVRAAVDPLIARTQELGRDFAEIAQQNDHLDVVRPIREAAIAAGIRPGGADGVAVRARQAGWGLIDGRLGQVAADGVSCASRNISGWIATDKERNGLCYQAGSISTVDRDAFRKNLDKIARGDVKVSTIDREGTP